MENARNFIPSTTLKLANVLFGTLQMGCDANVHGQRLMKTRPTLNILLLVLLGLPALVRAQGTAFSYQGHLVENGVAANGGHDFIFSLFDSAAAGAQVGPDMTLNNIPVASGEFNVTLDFGADAFPGGPRWLEISVRPAGVGQFTKMDERVSLLPTPYAIFAATAGSVANGALTASQLNTGGVAPTPGQFLSYSGGNLVWSDPGVAVGNIWSKNGADAFYNDGNVGIGLSAPTVGVRLEVNGTTKVNGGGSGGYVFFHTPSGESGMSIIGDNRADVRFDGSSLKLLAGFGPGAMPSENGIAITTGGSVGIGTTTPLAGFKLDVTGLTRMNPGGSGGELRFHTPSGETGMSLVGANRADVRFDGSSLKLLAGFGPGAMPSENGIAITTGGSVGVGTTTPVAKLDVESSQAGKSAVFGRETGTTGVGVYGEATATSGAGVFARNLNGVALDADGDAVQTRDKGGFIKAMVYVDEHETIARCYNGLTGASGSACGFTLTDVQGYIGIDFGFRVDDRFVSVTPSLGVTGDGQYVGGATAAVIYGYQPSLIGESHPNSIYVKLSLPPGPSAAYGFTVIVY